MNNKKNAYLGLFAAVAIIFGYVESLFPFFAGIPGIKLGLANLAVLFILETYTWKEAAVVSAVRIVVIGFLFGNMFTIIYSLAGAALSLFVMTLMKKKFRLQHSRHQRGRRRVPQYRSADGSCPDCGKHQSSLLRACTSDLRRDHRSSDRYPDKRSDKKNSSLSHFPYIVQYFISVPYRYPSSAQNALPFLL